MTKNANLIKAKNEKDDEYYTFIEDIEKQLPFYKDHFKGKVIYCNCDDPIESNFFKVLMMNYNEYKLAGLIATSYAKSKVAGTQMTLAHWFNVPIENRHGHYIEITGKIGKIHTYDEVKEYIVKNKLVKELKGNGSFDSPECIELLKRSDIVVTNPPFSLFRDFISILMKYHKKFLVIGSMNAITYKEIFPYIKDNKMWLGIGSVKKFIKPNGQTKTFGNICWYTNLEYIKRHNPLILWKEYNKLEYPKYDTYDAIDVSKVDYIPKDYYSVMGVPKSYLEKHCPEQFEIVGQMVTTRITEYNFGYPYINGKKKFSRILIKRK